MFFFFFNDTATTEIYTLSLHDALPILARAGAAQSQERAMMQADGVDPVIATERLSRRFGSIEADRRRSEEHTSELQSRQYLVCRLLLDKKKDIVHNQYS